MLRIYLSMLETQEEKTRFEHLYNTCKSLLYNHANRILGDHQLAEDAVHEAFMILANHMKNIEGRSDKVAYNYLIIIVKNTAKKIYNERKPVIYQEEVTDPHVDLRDAELDLKTLEEKHLLFHLIQSLDPMYSDPLLLQYYYGMSGKEVANILGISIENEKTRVYRAKEKIREIMEREKEHDKQPV